MSTFFEITQAFKCPLSVTERQHEVRATLAAAMLEASNTDRSDPQAFDVHHRLANAIALYGEWVLDD